MSCPLPQDFGSSGILQAPKGSSRIPGDSGPQESAPPTPVWICGDLGPENLPPHLRILRDPRASEPPKAFFPPSLGRRGSQGIQALKTSPPSNSGSTGIPGDPGSENLSPPALDPQRSQRIWDLKTSPQGSKSLVILGDLGPSDRLPLSDPQRSQRIWAPTTSSRALDRQRSQEDPDSGSLCPAPGSLDPHSRGDQASDPVDPGGIGAPTTLSCEIRRSTGILGMPGPRS